MPAKPVKTEGKSDPDTNRSQVLPSTRILNRGEIAEMAQAMMPEALKKIASVLHQTGSDLAALQAFRALKDAAYGKDPLAINTPLDFESLTDDELRAAIAAELGPGFTAGSADVEHTTQTPPVGEFD